MNKKIKIPFAGQKGIAAMLCIVCALLFMPVGCSEKPLSELPDEEINGNAVAVGDEKTAEKTVEDEFFYRADINEAGQYIRAEKVFLTVRKDMVGVRTKSLDDAEYLFKQKIFLWPEICPVSNPANFEFRYWLKSLIDPEETNLDDILKLPGVLDAMYLYSYEVEVANHLTGGTIMEEWCNFPTDLIQIYLNYEEEQSIEKVLNHSVLSGKVYSYKKFSYDSNIRGAYIIGLNSPMADMSRITRELNESGLCYAKFESIYYEPIFNLNDDDYCLQVLFKEEHSLEKILNVSSLSEFVEKIYFRLPGDNFPGWYEYRICLNVPLLDVYRIARELNEYSNFIAGESKFCYWAVPFNLENYVEKRADDQYLSKYFQIIYQKK